MTYRVVFTETAMEMLLEVSSRRDQQALSRRIHEVAADPQNLGKPLTRELADYWSTRAGGQRYRVIYHLNPVQNVMTVLAVGLRNEGSREDIYARALRLLDRGNLDPP